jgi:hypothetical protein
MPWTDMTIFRFGVSMATDAADGTLGAPIQVLMSIRHFDLRQHGSCWKTGVFSFSSSSLRQLSALSPRLADLLDTALRNRFWSQLQTFNICPFCPNSLTFRDALTTLDRNRVMHLVNLVKTSFPLSPSRFFSYSWNLTPFTPLAASFRNRFKHSFSERTNGQFPFSCLHVSIRFPCQPFR